MSWGIVAAAVGAVGAVGGAAISANAAEDAANTQAGAAREANALAREQFYEVRNDLSPYRQMGSDATNRLSQLLGIAPPPTQGVPPLPTLDQAWAEVDRRHREVHGTDSPRGEIQQVHAQNEFEKLMRDWEMQRAAAVDPSPAAEGQGNQLGYGSLLQNFTGEDLENEPGYAFGLSEGNKALDRRLASGGNYFSGAALKGATRFAQDYASQKYGEAYNRDAANKDRAFNFLTGAITSGQNAAAQTGSAGQTMSSQVGNNLMGAANVQGAAGIAGANAWGNAFNGVAGMASQQQMIQQNQQARYEQNELMRQIYGGNSGWGSESWRTSGNGMPY